MSQAMIRFGRLVTVLGRNGLFACSGLELGACPDEHDGHVAVTCLTSRGVASRALRMRVPSKALRDLADALAKLADEADKRKETKDEG